MSGTHPLCGKATSACRPGISEPKAPQYPRRRRKSKPKRKAGRSHCPPWWF